MARTFNRATELEALSLDDVVGLFAGDNTPDVDVSGAPINSRFFRSNGDTYKKIGAGDTLSDWELLGSASTTEALGFAIIGWE